jgi:peptidoglycan L-alanyl-D-glutamate endopeptidase CwlK
VSALLLSRVDTDLLYPPFLVKVQAVLDELLAAGVSYWVVEGFRTYDRSRELFAQGRTAPGPIVTRAGPGMSAHNFGLAVDLVRDGYVDRAGLQPDYRPSSYDALGPVVAKHGLVWGGTWQFKDLPHVQWPDFITGRQLDPIRTAFEAGGLSGAWDHLERIAALRRAP